MRPPMLYRLSRLPRSNASGQRWRWWGVKDYAHRVKPGHITPSMTWRKQADSLAFGTWASVAMMYSACVPCSIHERRDYDLTSTITAAQPAA